MSSKLVKRNIESVVQEMLSDTPVTMIQGARQVGKSTLAMMVSNNMNCMNVTLDSNEVLIAAKENPLEFVSQFREGLLIIDEVQRCPALLGAIKQSVDFDRRPGRFLITGSANILRLRDANESLAGRAETVILEPFSVGEKIGIKEDFVSMLMNGDILCGLQKTIPLSRAEYAELIIEGGYPDAIERVGKRRRGYFRNYISRVLDHDANELSGLTHLDRLNKLYTILAGEASGIYVKANVARLAGIPESSMPAYIRMLCDLCLVHMLPAWGKNYSRRIVNKPKMVIGDTGLACSLNGINSSFIANIEQGEVMGPLLEAFVISEINKQQGWSSSEYSLFHYRDRDNKEVDLVIELIGGQVIAIEIKAASSFSRKDFTKMKMLRELLGKRFHCGVLLYTGNVVQPFGDKLFAAPISAIWNEPSINR